jgi:hypothetical protein
MFNDNGLQMTLCGILRKISEKTGDEEIVAMAEEATTIAKKMDKKLKEYSLQAQRMAQTVAQHNWQ